MKTIAALILAGLLAVMAYGIFWLVCLTYTTDQMRDAVKEALGAEMSYGTAQWVPDPAYVTMDLPAAKLVLPSGPVREVRAPNLRLVSDFLMRDRWRIEVPPRVEIVMASGKTLLLETEQGEVAWLKDGNRLTLRANRVALLDLNGTQIAQIGDVMLERKAFDNGIRVSLASRPTWNGVEGVLSGHIVLPEDAFGAVVNLLGTGAMPGVGDIFGAIAASLQAGGDGRNTLELQNVSFKTGDAQPVSGAVFGKVQVLRDGRMTGTLTATADTAARVVGWVQKAGVIAPRNNAELAGVARFPRASNRARPTITLENMQSTLMVNGQPVGPLPDARSVAAKLW